jgi:anaerobic magnesium-protoporphyrin IX monomethyl ester cyclase
MYKSGCRIINYGLESGNQAVLDKCKKGFTLEQVRKSLDLTYKAKIQSFGTFILGLPGDTPKTCIETIEFAKSLPLSIVQFYLCVPYPGSKIYEDWVNKSDNWESYTTMGSFSDNVVYTPDGMFTKELKDLQKRAYREFYFRPQIFFRHLINIRTLSDIKRYWDVLLALRETL